MSNSKLLICSVFLSFSFFISFASSSYFNTTLTTTHQCSALLLFKQNLSSFNFSIDYYYYHPCKDWLGSEGYYYPIMMNWNASTDCCYWDGVTCDHSTGDVIGLDLSCGMLQGTLHPNTSLFNLPHLQSLNLAFNNFTGSKFPREIGRFSSTLTHLNISGCKFSGNVPTGITRLQKLVSLDLSLNKYDDFCLEPHVFINMLQNYTSLEELSLEGVGISSVLPTYLNISSSSLKLLKLQDTGLQGKLPHYIFRIQSLEKLDLSFNSFTGQIPWEISLLPKLVSIDLLQNDHNLRIKTHTFNSLLQNSTLLRDLRLGNVNISSDLPTYLNTSSLKSLDLSYTSLKGKLPDSIFNLQYLEALDLSGNINLTGPLPRVNASILPLKRLRLSRTNLSGEIPDSIGNFKSLTFLDLSYCNFMGPLPRSIVKLRHLTSLHLSSNKLNGTLPSSLFSLRSLETLDLANNQFDGPLPSSLFSLRSLETVHLANNQFDGQIDVLDDQGPILQTFQQLTNLTFLDLSHNNFSGDWELDTLLSSLTNLYSLILSYSGFSVTTRNANHHVNPDFENLGLASCKIKVFPGSLRSMRNLQYLDLSSNEIHRQIPHWAGEIGGSTLNTLNLSYNFITGLPQFQWYGLQELYLQSNLIQEPFHPSICNLSNLWYLDLSSNEIHGQIPQWAGEIGGSTLYYLNLSNNFITGLPQFQWYGLQELYLQSNLIQGPFPQSICNMTNLLYLDLSNNSFDGVIPQCLGNITSSLLMINLGNNRFQGSIPNVYENCGYLNGLILNGNQLNGELPSSLSKCQFLKILDIGNNHLNGTFPSWLGDFPDLQALILKSNSFHGRIVPSCTVRFPFQTLRVLDLSHNGFVGQLPAKFFQNFKAMKNVVKMNTKPEYLSIGRIYYSIVVEVKGQERVFPKLFVDYTIVDLSRNTFDGEIPNIIGTLNSLKVLNLSHNNLIGQIPHTLRDLCDIESLDLSWNQLTGEIPRNLVDIKGLAVLNLSQNYLRGCIPQGSQFNTFDKTSFGGNLGLCGFPLPTQCEHGSSPQAEGDGNADEENGITWKVVMLGYGCGTLLGSVMGYLMLSTGKPKWFNAIADKGEHLIQIRQNKKRHVYIGK